MVYGRAPPKLLDYRIGGSLVEAVSVMLTHRRAMIRSIRSHLQAAQNRMKYYADKKQRPFEFNEWDCVWLKLRPTANTRWRPEGGKNCQSDPMDRSRWKGKSVRYPISSRCQQEVEFFRYSISLCSRPIRESARTLSQCISHL